jgi:predicted nucleic acid-binding protein
VFPAFLDTCVLLKPYLCDTLLSIAESGVYRPLWSADILAELRRNMVRRGLKDTQVDHRQDQMIVYFPHAEVTGYQELIPAMTNHRKDQHVLAAAIRGGADVLVTENLRDFPDEAMAAYDLRAVHQDDFLLDQLDLWPATVLDALRRQTSRYLRAPRTPRDLLEILGAQGSGCPRFAEACLRVL